MEKQNLTQQNHAFTTAPHQSTNVLRPFPFPGTTWVSRCQNRTSGLYGARDDWQRQTRIHQSKQMYYNTK